MDASYSHRTLPSRALPRPLVREEFVLATSALDLHRALTMLDEIIKLGTGAQGKAKVSVDNS